MKEEFPILKTGYTYLDTAASAQKPREVLEAIDHFYRTGYSNVHRGLHEWAEYSTIQYNNARKKVAEFLNAAENEIVFTSGATESMNLLASTYPLNSKDTVITTVIEHHSTFVPWQQAAKRAGAKFKVIPTKEEGVLDYDAAEQLIAEGCTILAITHLSNVTGECIDVKRLAKKVHGAGGKIFVDGAQAVVHLELDVKELDIDAYCFSGHKLYGPTGIGVLYGKYELLDSLPPYQYGGEMIAEVTFEKTTFAEPPLKFEAGTPPIAQAVGLRAAIEWLDKNKDARIKEQEAVDYCVQELKKLPFITLTGPDERVGTVSFVLDKVHPHDVAQFLDSQKVAIRAGQHCTQPLHDKLCLKATCRASFGIYNTKEDVDKLIIGLKKCKEAFDV